MNKDVRYTCIHTHTYIHTHNGTLLSYKKNEIMLFITTWMDWEIIILKEVRQTEKDKYHMTLPICGI